MNQIDLNGRVAVITGGARGIGLATAERMLRSSARVFAWDLDPAAIGSARASTPGLEGLVADVTDEASVAAATQATLERAGRIDILVNCAGLASKRLAVADYPVTEWRRVVEVNLTGTFIVCRAVVPHLVAADYGRIVNLSSIAGKEGNPFNSPYSAAKAGVIALTKSLAKELVTTGIRVNCVTPAAIETDLFRNMSEESRRGSISRIPMGRVGKAEEVAALIAWLASEECSFSTGAAFDLSGGRATY